MWNLHKIKLMADDKVLSYCQNTLEFIGEGTGRQVFAISDDLVIKIAFNNAGIRQSEMECHLHGNDICANIYQHHKNYVWTIMDRLLMYDDDGEFEYISGSTTEDKRIWCEYHQLIEMDTIDEQYKKMVIDRYDKMVSNAGVEWIEQMKESEVVNNLITFVVNNKMESGDLTRRDGWGYIKGDKDKPIMFDYGLSSAVWNECYSRRFVSIKFGDGESTVRLVEPIDNQAKAGDLVKVWINGKPDMFEVIGETVDPNRPNHSYS